MSRAEVEQFVEGADTDSVSEGENRDTAGEVEAADGDGANVAARLAEAEQKITNAVRAAFYDVGAELRRIRVNRLYRANYSSFNAYCDERWGWTETHVSRLIQAADLCDDLSKDSGVPLPTRERHVRPLASLPDAKQRTEAWRKACEKAEAENVQMTGRHVSVEVRRIKKKKEKSSGGVGQKKGKIREKALPLTVAIADIGDLSSENTVSQQSMESVEVLYLSTPSADLPGAMNIIKELGLSYRDCGAALLEKKGETSGPRELWLALRATRNDNVHLPEPRIKHGAGQDVILDQIKRLHPKGSKIDLGTDVPSREGWERPSGPDRSSSASLEKPSTKKSPAQRPAKKKGKRTSTNKTNQGETKGGPSERDVLVEGIALATGSEVEDVRKRLDADHGSFISFLYGVAAVKPSPALDALRHPGVVAAAYLCHQDDPDRAETIWRFAVAGTSSSKHHPVMELHQLLWGLGEKGTENGQGTALTSEQVKANCLEIWKRLPGNEVADPNEAPVPATGTAPPDEPQHLEVEADANGEAQVDESARRVAPVAGDAHADGDDGNGVDSANPDDRGVRVSGGDPRLDAAGADLQKIVTENTQGEEVELMPSAPTEDEPSTGDNGSGKASGTIIAPPPQRRSRLRPETSIDGLEQTLERKLDRYAVNFAADFLEFHKDDLETEAMRKAIEDRVFHTFFKAVAGATTDVIGGRMRHGPTVAAMATIWAEAPVEAKEFWCHVRDDEGEEPCKELHKKMLNSTVRQRPGEKPWRDTMSQRKWFDVCLDAWRRWRRWRRGKEGGVVTVNESVGQVGVTPAEVG